MSEWGTYCFTSKQFPIVAGEDDATNPGVFGKALGQWLCDEFERAGYSSVQLIAEDWGWCVMCVTEPYPVFVACNSLMEKGAVLCDLQQQPSDLNVIWKCYVSADRPFFRNPFKKLDSSKEHEVAQHLWNILDRNPSIMKVTEF